MKRSHWVLAVTSALVMLVVAPAASAESPGKAEICHRTASGSVEWRLITVSTKSLDQHIEHGDGVPLGDVPGSDGELMFDESCGVVPGEAGDPGDPGDPGNPGDPGESETVFAIAYSDLDQDGTYEDDVDVLIAKFIDGSGDGLPGAGDVIITDRYPMELGLGSFGEFGVTEHTVTGVNPTSTECMASTSGGSFIWESSSTVDNYEERASSGALSYFRDSLASGGSDAAVANSASPSSPTEPVTAGAFDDIDHPFVEVDLNCSA